MNTTARIRTKALTNTGLTDDHAERMFNNIGSHHLAIVELKVTQHAETDDGEQKVDLIITMLEPSTTPDMDDHLRELARALAYERRLHAPDEQLTIDNHDDLNPRPADVIAHALRHTPHTYNPTPGTTQCDTCGHPEPHTLHTTE